MPMNRSFRYDLATKDLVFEPSVTSSGSSFEIIEGNEEVIQSLTIRLLTEEGEDFVDPRAGLPINSMVGLFDEGLIEGFLRRTLRQDPRVESVDSLDISIDRSVRRVDVLIELTLIDSSVVQLNTTL